MSSLAYMLICLPALVQSVKPVLCPSCDHDVSTRFVDRMRQSSTDLNPNYLLSSTDYDTVLHSTVHIGLNKARAAEENTRPRQWVATSVCLSSTAAGHCVVQLQFAVPGTVTFISLLETLPPLGLRCMGWQKKTGSRGPPKERKGKGREKNKK